MHNKNSGFSQLFLILILTVGLAGILALYYISNYLKNGGLLVQNTKNAASEVKTIQDDTYVTYINKKYEYELKYKKVPIYTYLSCGPKPGDFNGEEFFVVTYSSSMVNSKVCVPLEGVAPIEVYVSSGNILANEAIYKSYPKDLYDVQVTELFIDSYNAKKIDTKYTAEDESGLIRDITEVRIYNQNTNSTYYLILSDKDFAQTYEQILASFRFRN